MSSSSASSSAAAVVAVSAVAASSAGPTDHGLVMAREPLRWAPGEPLWIFGYGSVVWKVGFEFTERRIVYARGWR